MAYFWGGFAVQLVVVHAAIIDYSLWRVRIRIRRDSGTWILL